MSGRKIIVDFLLWFKKKHYREVMVFVQLHLRHNVYPSIQVYKNLFGRKYILGLYEKPPEHFNCRCVSDIDIFLASCPHLKTHNEDWPDGEVIEVCDECGRVEYI